jgi:hypothetical protein
METHLVFDDAKKAYDRAPLAKLWLTMIEQNVNITCVKTVKDLHINKTGK